MFDTDDDGLIGHDKKLSKKNLAWMSKKLYLITKGTH